MDANFYATARRNLLGVPNLEPLVPRFVKTCRTPDEFWNFIKNEFPTYAERRTYLAEKFNPIIDRLDQMEQSTSSALELGERLGEGGFGVVYKARHELLKMDFAVKVFDPSFDDGNPTDLDRFFREARILLRLLHPNIVRFYDAGIVGGKPFIRMEYFAGKNLNEFLRQHGPLPSGKALVLMTKVVSAIAHAHSTGTIHRDLKPSNVMLAAGEDVRVVDFGLGTFVEADLVSRITKTGEGALGGYYTAPELVANPKLLDPKTDIYSIGAVWYTALTGLPPGGSDLSTQLDALQESEPLVSVIRRCLSSPERRFSTATELLAAIDSV